jgi:DNA-binding transcriptional LysR family regulator
VSAGVGVTLLPQSIAAAPQTGVVFRPLTGMKLMLPMHLIWRDCDLPPTGERFRAVARELTGSILDRPLPT